MNKFLHIAFLLMIVSAASAQRLPFKNYTTADGLPGPVIRDLVQDKYGYIWINTDGGMAQFDGVTFKNYTTGDSLAFVFRDSLGYVYLSSRVGLWRIAGEARELYPFTRDLGPVQKVLYIKDGALWFWHQRNRQDTTKYAGLSKFANNRLEEYPDTLPMSDTESYLAGFVDDDEGNFWVRFWSMKSHKNIWHKLANGQFTNGINAYGISEDWDIWDFKVDRYGSLWFFRNKYIGKQRLQITYKFAKGRLIEYSDSTSGFHFDRSILDREQNLWLPAHGPHRADDTYHGLGVAKATVDTFKWFTQKQGLPNDKVKSIFQGKSGKLWFTTWEGVSLYQAGKMQNITKNLAWPDTAQVLEVFEDAKNNVWFMWRRDSPLAIGIAVYAKGELKNYSAEHGIVGESWVSKRSMGLNSETFFGEDNDGNVWFQSDKALFRFSNGKWQTYDQKNGLPGPFALMGAAFFQDREGNLWIGTQNGLSKLADQSYERYTTEDGLTSNMVTSPYQDQQGRLWMLADIQLHHMRGNRVERFTLVTGKLLSFYEDKSGNIWLSTREGTSKIDGTKLHDMALVEPKPFWTAFQDDQGNIWFGSYRGVSKFDGKNFQYYNADKDGFVKGPINKIFQDWRSHLWFVTNVWPFVHGGLSDFDGTKFRNYSTNNGELDPAGWEYSIDQSKHVWLRQKGVLRDLTDPTVPIRKVPDMVRTGTTANYLENFNSWEDLLRPTRAPSFWDREGNCWLCTPDGLVKIGAANSQVFTTADGLPGNRITGIAQDSLGNIWVGTQKGIGGYDGTRFHDYNREHGLEPIAINGDPVVDKNGNVWFGSVAGLIKVNIARAFEKNLPPLLYLKAVQIDTVQISPRENLKLEHKQNNLVFSYIGLCFKNEKAIRYQYFLDGYDNEWSQMTDKREVRYTNLDPSSYVFKVKAISGAGVESEIASTAFTILPPYWKTWWFLTVSSLSTLLVGYVIYRQRVNAKLEKARILNELKAAHDMQMGLMPKCDPVIPGFDISGICKPAEEVGGDYFDYVWLNEEKTKFGIAVVDVSGKAMKGAMTAVMTSGMIYSEIGNSQSPCAILQKINKPMYLKTDRHIFTTMSFAVIDTQSKTLTFSNAGQTQPIMKRNREIQYLKVEGMHFPLGIQQGVQYGEITVQLQPSDVVIFHTDGLSEAMNEKNELFDFERMETVIRNLPDQIRAAEVVEKLLSEVERFSGAAKQHDDMTVVVAKVIGSTNF